eukprot:177875-Chlamydomonas_euryale.AAC.2
MSGGCAAASAGVDGRRMRCSKCRCGWAADALQQVQVWMSGGCAAASAGVDERRMRGKGAGRRGRDR